MKKILTCNQMKALDENTICGMHIPSAVLMERAALAVADQIRELPGEYPRVLVVCGSGNNGGDGLAIARLLQLQGINTDIYLAGDPKKMTPETARQLESVKCYQISVTNNPVWDEYTVIVDAIFGVGLSRPVGGHYAELIRQMNDAKAFKVAVDIPSGISGDTGELLGTAFMADLTVTFAYIKRGLCLYPGRKYAGKVVTADIGIYDKDAKGRELAANAAWYVEERDLAQLPQRASDGNKGTFGKILFVAGSKGMCGAAYLCAAAALYAGTGMVKLQTVDENRIPLQTLLPEAMLTCEFNQQENEKNLDWCDVLVIGPGLGTNALSTERMLWFLRNGHKKGKPIVLDADGLNLLAAHPGWLEYIDENTVLTPHIGEMNRLTGIQISDLKKDPVFHAVKYAGETGAVCVLKDACTVIADHNEKIYLNLCGNSGMATAGSGDVLSGLIAAALCMYLSEEDKTELAYKAAMAVYLHGRSGDFAAEHTGSHGMTARSMLGEIPGVLKLSER